MRLDGKRRQTRLFLLNDGFVGRAQFIERGPLLSVEPDILALVRADRAMRGRLIAASVLGAARFADRVHLTSLTRRVVKTAMEKAKSKILTAIIFLISASQNLHKPFTKPIPPEPVLSVKALQKLQPFSAFGAILFHRALHAE